MTKRKIKKALKRLYYIPKGKNFFKYSFNKLNHFIKKYKKSTSVAYPSTIMIEVTNHCNLHCITCPREYEYGNNMDMGFIDLKNLKTIVNQAYPYIDSIGLTGLGEPLMYKQLPDALEYIKSKNKGIITSISTNASLNNTAQIIEKVKHNLDTVQISIDGIGEVYNKVRKNGNYEKFIRNVKEILEITKKTNTDVMFNVVIVKENYKQMKDLIKLANELGVNYINFSLFNLASVTDIPVSYYDFYSSGEFINELIAAEKEAEKYSDLEFTSWDYKSENSFQKCEYPWTHFYFTWDGFLVPCCAKPFPKELNFGNVFTTPIIETLNSKGFKNFRKMWFENKAPNFCKKCHYLDLKSINPK